VTPLNFRPPDPNTPVVSSFLDATAPHELIQPRRQHRSTHARHARCPAPGHALALAGRPSTSGVVLSVRKPDPGRCRKCDLRPSCNSKRASCSLARRSTAASWSSSPPTPPLSSDYTRLRDPVLEDDDDGRAEEERTTTRGLFENK
jgi:hypothetical protein